VSRHYSENVRRLVGDASLRYSENARMLFSDASVLYSESVRLLFRDASLRYSETVRMLKNGVFWDVTPCGSCKNRVSEKFSASFIKVTRIDELGTTLAVTSNRRTLRRSTWYFFAARVGCS
jgi:hypothetical protein